MKKAAYVLSGFAAGVIVSGGVAIAGTTLVSAQKENATVQVNGGYATSGSALVYGGTTFSELYTVQQSLQKAGLTTSWDGHTLNINVPGLQQSTSSSGDSLTDMLNPYQSSGNFTVLNKSYKGPNAMTMMGVNYTNGLSFSAKDNNEIDYNLHGQYHTLTATLGPDDSRGSEGYNTISFYGDGNLLKSYDIHNHDEPQQINLDVSGVTQLRIVCDTEIDNLGNYAFYGNIDLANITLK